MSSAPWQKPFRGMQINKAHPLAKGLVGCYVMNEDTGAQITNLVDRMPSSEFTSGILWNANGLYFDGTEEYVEIKTKQFENIFHKGATGHLTIVCRYAPAQVSSPEATKVYTLLGSEQVAGDRVKFYHSNNWGTNELYLDVSDGWSNTSITTGTITSSLTEGQFSDIVVAWDGANAHIYIDGIDKTTSGALVAANFPDGVQNYFRIGDQQNTVHYLYGGLEFVYLFDRYLSPEDVMQLHREPYAMFQQPISPASLYYDAIAATDVYLTLSQTAGIAESGQAVAEGPVTLSNTLAAVDGGAANALAPVTLSDILSLTVSAEAIAQSTITIAEILSTLQAATTPGLGLIDTPNKRRSVMGIPAIPNNQIYGRDKQQIAGLYRGSFEYVPGALSLNEILALTSAGQVAASSDVTLSKVLTILQNYLTDFEGSITLNETLTTLFASEATAHAFITFAKTLTVAQTTAEVTQVYLTLAYNLAVQTQASSIAAAALTMAINAGISAIVTIEVAEDLALSQILAVAQSATAETLAQLSLNNILAVSVVAEALASAGISLNMVEVVITDSGPTFEVTTPSGRTITIAAEVRTATVADEDRTVVIN